MPSGGITQRLTKRDRPVGYVWAQTGRDRSDRVAYVWAHICGVIGRSNAAKQSDVIHTITTSDPTQNVIGRSGMSAQPFSLYLNWVAIDKKGKLCKASPPVGTVIS
jgi:hypothetical protein